MKRTPNGNVLIKFVQSFGSYAIGTKAAFPEPIAAKHVAAGRAVHIGVPATSARPVAAAPAPEPDDDVVKKDPLDQVFKAGDAWRDLHHATLKSIAKDVSDSPITSKDDAIAAIELALEERAGE